MRTHKIRTLIQVNGSRYLLPTNAATALSRQTANKLAAPKYNDAHPPKYWDPTVYWSNYRRIEKRAYDRFLKVCTVLLT